MKKEKKEEKKKKKRTRFVKLIRRVRERIRIYLGRRRSSKYIRKRLLNIFDLSIMLDVPVPTLYRWVHEKRLPSVKLTKSALHFDPEEIERWIQNKKVNESKYWKN